MPNPPFHFDQPAIVRTAKRSLKECADAANNALDRGEKAFVEAGLALKEALDQVPRGQRLAWLKENFKGSKAAAYRLIRACDCFKVRQLGAVADGFSEPVTIPDDGPSQPVTAEKPSGAILCHACLHRRAIGRPLIKDCEECAKLRNPVRTEPSPKGPSMNAPTPYIPPDASDAYEPCDDAPPPPSPPNTDLPKPVQAALADTWHFEVAAQCDKRRKETLAAANRSEWLDVARAIELWKELNDLYLSAAPRRRCPDCDGQQKVGGESCHRCRGCGYLASQGG